MRNSPWTTVRTHAPQGTVGRTSRVGASRPAGSAVWALAGSLAVTLAAASAMAKKTEELEDWLKREPLRLLVAQTDGQGCTTCARAGSRFRAMARAERKMGLRVAALVFPDDSGQCPSPAWKPDVVFCDEDGSLRQRIGLSKPGEALLWSWRGRMVAQTGSVDEMEKAIGRAAAGNMRLVLEPRDERSRPAPELGNAVRAAITEMGRFSIMEPADEKKRLDAIQKNWLGSAMAGKSGVCEFGDESAPDHVLRVKIAGLRRKKEIHLTLLSGKASCVLLRTEAPYDPKKPNRGINKALTALIERARRPLELPVEAKTAAEGLSSMVRVPGGPFHMGCNIAVDGACMRHESPGRKIVLSAFEIDRTEVTAHQYAECVEAGGCAPVFAFSPACNWGKPKQDQHPINCVSWEDAHKFCAWAKKRLPTEAEWEKAARGTDGRIYPWGNDEPSCEKAVMDGKEGKSCGRGSATWRAGSRAEGVSPYGAFDMAGNVSEWVADWYGDRYYETAPEKDPPGPRDGTMRVFRGGGYFSRNTDLRTSFRERNRPGMRNGSLGFRCARSID